MFRIYTVMIAAFVAAAVGVVALEAQVASADWSAIGKDWDEAAPVTKTLESGDRGALADHFFHVEWTVAPDRSGHPRISGYVYNDYGDSAVNLTLRISEVDASGQDVESVVEPIGDTIPGLGRAYFSVRVPDSRSYRVAVSAFDFVELSN
jgi:hypothetical protein